jgi:hypothetical protein
VAENRKPEVISRKPNQTLPDLESKKSPPTSAMGFWTTRSCGVDSGFQPRLCHSVGTGALAGRAIAILSIVFGFGEALFARLPGQRLL